MKKLFLMAALVLASTSGSNVCAMNEAVQEASLSELMPVKKKTKKTSKKTSKKKLQKETHIPPNGLWFGMHGTAA